MIINELYDMAKEFVNDFEEAETEVIQYLKTELDKNNYDVELSKGEKEECGCCYFYPSWYLNPSSAAHVRSRTRR